MQTFLFHANVLGTAAARLAGVPIVVTGVRVAERRANWHVKLARWTDRWVDRHVAVSTAVRDFSLAEGIGTSDKWVVIPNGVDLARFEGVVPAAKESLGVPAERGILVCIGRLDPQKGIDWLIEQTPRLLAAETGYDLVLVGEGPLREELVALAARLGVAARVHFVGFRGDVPAVLTASKLLVLPSRWEGMPNVVLESMAAGKPVVASRIEGVEEVLGAGAAEQTFAPGDIDEMARKIAAILHDPMLAGRLGARIETGCAVRSASNRWSNGTRRCTAPCWQMPAKSRKTFSLSARQAKSAQNRATSFVHPRLSPVRCGKANLTTQTNWLFLGPDGWKWGFVVIHAPDGDLCPSG